MQTRPTYRRVLAAALTALITAIVPLAGQNRATQNAADIPKIQFEKYTLPNGLEVILSEDHRLPIVTANLWYHAGAANEAAGPPALPLVPATPGHHAGPANEAAGRTGFAHLFEHLMFQGSKHTPRDSHFQMLEAAGATGINGTTDYDRTNYFETVPANQLELALWIESDRMGYLLDVLDQAQLSNQQD